MSGLFSTLHTASSGMRVNQKSIQTVSHNISNINTPGYSRQRVEVETNRPLYMPSLNNNISKGQLGMGVQVTDVTRARNTFYDYQFRTQYSKYGQISAKYDYYTSIENIVKEPSEHGISANLNKFFDGWEELSKDTNNNSSKNLVVENGVNLSTLISDTYEKLHALKGDINSNIDKEIEEINSMLDKLKALEKDINVVGGTGSTPNDLLDEKDRILDELSSKLDIQNKDVQELLKDGKLDRTELENALNNGVQASGTLQGYHEMSQKVDSYTNSLKQISDGIVDSINKAFGGTFFEKGNPENGEPLIKVNQDLKHDPSLIDIDKDKAKAIFDVSKQKVEIDGKNITINDHYNSFAERIGIDAQKVIKDEAHQREIITATDEARMSVSGVSLDEEMISLIQLQHSYGANAKVLATVNQLLDVVINGLI